jgi:hypothetical protein
VSTIICILSAVLVLHGIFLVVTVCASGRRQDPKIDLGFKTREEILAEDGIDFKDYLAGGNLKSSSPEAHFPPTRLASPLVGFDTPADNNKPGCVCSSAQPGGINRKKHSLAKWLAFHKSVS